jgi:hypothetical protein
VSFVWREWLNACTRAITSCMHAPDQGHAGFKRQVVFRIGAEDWPLLEAAAAEHGSIQAAVLAGLRNLTSPASAATPGESSRTRAAVEATAQPKRAKPARAAAAPPAADPEEEISCREAGQLLGLRTSTISGYIRSGRLPGCYRDRWLTTRAAVEAYRQHRRA